MRTLLISYDLAKPYRNKHVLAQQIMRLGARWARPLDQTWYISTECSEIEVEAELSGILEADDGMVIQVVSEDAVLSNTQLRWFRQRRADTGSAETTNVIAFPMVFTPPAQAELPLDDVSGSAAA